MIRIIPFPQVRRVVFGTALALLACLACGSDARAERSKNVPNIVFILADDLSWSDLGCYGNTVHETPCLDRLAREGMRLTQAYAPAPICSASRAAILTGKTPARLHFEFVTKSEPGQQTLDVPLQSPPFTLNLPLSEETMGEVLAKAGYATGFFGKWHVSQHHQGYLGWSPTHGPFQQGFESGDSSFGGHPYAYRSQKTLRNKTVPDGEFPADELHDKAITYLQENQDRPFFLYLSQYFVHDPVHTRCNWLKEKAAQRLPAGADPIRRDYAAMVATLDHQVGRVLTALDQLELTDQTLIVFTSDNGGHPNYTSNSPLRGSKWNLYEGGIRVPMLVRWPGQVAPGTQSEAIVHGCDLFPTFCDVANTRPVESQRDGVSLLPLFDGGTRSLDRKTPLVWHFPYYHPERGFDTAPTSIGVADFVTSQTRPHSAIRDGDWKLLYFYEDERTELYNLAQDLSENNDLSVPEQEKTSRLQEKLEMSLGEMNARWPVQPD